VSRQVKSARDFDLAALTRDLARELGAKRVIALGAPRPERLAAAAAGLELIALDVPDRTTALRQHAPEAQAEDWDPAAARPVPLSGDVLRDAVVLCDGVIEELDDPDPLLARLREALEDAPAAVVVTADRDLVGRGAPAKPRRSAKELTEHIERAGIELSWLGIGSSPWDRLERSSSLAVLGGNGGEGLSDLLETGVRNLRFDWGAKLSGEGGDGTAGGGERLRICIATYEFVGPTKTGGIGTAYTSLAEALAEAGHEVRVLYLGLRTPEDEKAPFSHWVEHYAERGIDLVELPEPGLPRVFYGHFEAKRSYLAYLWLAEADRERPWDVIHFPETLGHGYYTQLAKRQGWAFERATIAIGIHSSTFWVVETNRTTYLTGQEFAADFLERTSVALADVVISPSAYMVDWMKSKGWSLPERLFIQQYVRSRVVAEPAAERHGRIGEFVFFGRLETRKGIRLFCDALDQLASEGGFPDVVITFMGKQTPVDHEWAARFIRRRSAEGGWPWEVKIIDDYDQPQAVAYLRGDGDDVRRLAVMPSLVDNTPNTVMEALALRIPFIASRVGGTAELVHPLDLGRSTFDPRGRGGASDLAAALRDAAAASDFRPPRPAVEPDPNEFVHLDWHAGVARVSREAPVSEEPDLAAVRVISVVTQNGAGAGATIESLEAQDHPGLTVVPVSGEAGRPDALNRGARAGSGDYLLFLRSGAVAEPNLVSSLVRVARRTGADVVAPAARWSVGADEGIRPPEGGPPVAGLFYRAFGDGGYLIRRDAFESLGGFDPDVEPAEDHHLLCRAALQGRRIETVPEPLLRQRIPDENTGEAIHAPREESLRAYQQVPLNGLAELPQIAQAQWILSGSKDAQIRGIVESRSWRLTTPLRWVTKKLKRRSEAPS
jgi:O-antigen biosynthesis protein